MPVTYSLIASNTLSSSAASVTFSAIPNTYTDLVLRWSGRGDSGTQYWVTFNGVGGTSYSQTRLNGTGLTASSGRDSSYAYWRLLTALNQNGYTANSFDSNELYIPNYTASQNKPMSHHFVTETNLAEPVYLGVNAGLFSNTSAISSISLTPNSGNIVSGSSFFLYGIKNS